MTSISNCITVYSLKGNTLGILEGLNPDHFEFCRIGRGDSNPLTLWEKSKTILLGTSTYYPSNTNTFLPPAHLKTYLKDLSELKDKEIILFGSGRSEYPLFCGAVDYLNMLLKDKNDIKLIYKFEGYPRTKQKIEFKKKVEEIIYAND